MRASDWRLASAALLVLTTGSGVANASQTCTARSIARLGRCLHSPSVKAVVDREIRGIAPPAARSPEGIDGDLLATRLSGAHATGEWSPVSGKPGEWILVVRPAAVTGSDSFKLAAGSDQSPSLIVLARIARAPASDPAAKSRVEIVATADHLWSDDAAAPPCVDPEDRKGEEFNSSGGYPDIGGEYRSIALSPTNRVIAATVGRTEGYAGGGGSFTGTVLLSVSRGHLVPVGCYATARYQMFGGDWNADGTRQHPESNAQWRMVPEKQGVWPTLDLVATTSSTPGATLVWDNEHGHYRGVGPSH